MIELGILNDKHRTAFVERHRDRVLHQRFGSDQLDLETRMQLERSKSSGRFQWLCCHRFIRLFGFGLTTGQLRRCYTQQQQGDCRSQRKRMMRRHLCIITKPSRVRAASIDYPNDHTHQPAAARSGEAREVHRRS